MYRYVVLGDLRLACWYGAEAMRDKAAVKVVLHWAQFRQLLLWIEAAVAGNAQSSQPLTKLLTPVEGRDLASKEKRERGGKNETGVS